MAAIYSNGGNRWNILGFNFTKRDALSSVYKISMKVTSKYNFRNNKHFNIPKYRTHRFRDIFINISSLQLISRNFGRASCEVGWEFGNYKHKIIKLIGNRPIKFGSFASNYRNSL